MDGTVPVWDEVISRSAGTPLTEHEAVMLAVAIGHAPDRDAVLVVDR
jgi:hypothetical protein